MFEKSILESAKSKVKDLYLLSSKQIERAEIVLIFDCVKPFRSDKFPDSFHVHSLTRSVEYSVNIASFVCQCDDYTENNKGQETIHICKHIIAATLYRHYHAALETQAREQPWQVQIDKLIQHAMS